MDYIFTGVQFSNIILRYNLIYSIKEIIITNI